MYNPYKSFFHVLFIHWNTLVDNPEITQFLPSRMIIYYSSENMTENDTKQNKSYITSSIREPLNSILRIVLRDFFLMFFCLYAKHEFDIINLNLQLQINLVIIWCFYFCIFFCVFLLMIINNEKNNTFLVQRCLWLW